MQVKKLKLRSAGMFSNINEVIQHLYLAEKSNYKFIIDWSESCYRESWRTEDPWSYYFYPCFPEALFGNINPESLPILPCGESIACCKNNIITPRLYEGKCSPLLLPKKRTLACKFIDNYIFLKPHISKEIHSFQDQYFGSHVVGLHIRGAGKTDGGVSEYVDPELFAQGIPFSLYFRRLDKIIRRFDSQVFVCSDSSLVIDKVKKEYGDRVIVYEATRSPFGEMHANHDQNAGAEFPRFKLGMDVIVEAYLLAKTQFLIHG
ncbi:MAG: hypothetical protein ACO31I_17775, partial [Prochlorotrichaceae cyanobacterium]